MCCQQTERRPVVGLDAEQASTRSQKKRRLKCANRRSVETSGFPKSNCQLGMVKPSCCGKMQLEKPSLNTDQSTGTVFPILIAISFSHLLNDTR
jgi:hypothetical protein